MDTGAAYSQEFFEVAQLTLQPDSPPFNQIWRRHPVAGRCMAVVVLNWMLFFAITLYCGGFALGTRPSVDGFVLVNHGHRSPRVSESVWLFCLAYGGLTMLLSPLVMIVLFRVMRQERFAGDHLKWIILCAVLGLMVWEWCVVSSLAESIRDWSKLRRPPVSALGVTPVASRLPPLFGG
jgi:hypothetical protein